MMIYSFTDVEYDKVVKVLEAAKKLRHAIRSNFEEHPLEFIEFDVALLELEQKG